MISFIVDAQLPYGIAELLRKKGVDTIHTNDMPNKARTSDSEIRVLAKNDFFDSYILAKSPSRLLLIATGNIINKVLFNLFEKHLEWIVTYFESYNFLELTNSELFAHE